jgi:hypothetical protein
MFKVSTRHQEVKNTYIKQLTITRLVIYNMNHTEYMNESAEVLKLC